MPKNLILSPNKFLIREFLRFAQDDASGDLPPQNDGMSSRQLFSISNFRSPLHLDITKLILYYIVENFERREKKYENEGFF